VKRVAGALADRLGAERWVVEVAVVTWLVAELTLPPETSTKLARAETLSAAEMAMVRRCPEIATRLIAPSCGFRSSSTTRSGRSACAWW
jgi:hypothetical protein